MLPNLQAVSMEKYHRVTGERRARHLREVSKPGRPGGLCGVLTGSERRMADTTALLAAWRAGDVQVVGVLSAEVSGELRRQ